MKTVEKCDLCETALVMEAADGQRLRFTKHDAAFCRDLTLGRIRTLERMLRDQMVETARSERARAESDRRLDSFVETGADAPPRREWQRDEVVAELSRAGISLGIDF